GGRRTSPGGCPRNSPTRPRKDKSERTAAPMYANVKSTIFVLLFRSSQRGGVRRAMADLRCPVHTVGRKLCHIFPKTPRARKRLPLYALYAEVGRPYSRCRAVIRCQVSSSI